MKQVRFEFEELPYDTLSQFGLTQEMIEDLPMQTLEAISHGKHSPVLPIKVNDENGNTVTDRSRFAFVRKENGEADVIFFPVLKKSPLEKYNEEQKKQLQSGKTMLSEVVAGNFANYGGKIDTLGLVSDNPEDNYVQLPMGSTQFADGKFTVDDYKALVADMFAGKITVSNDTTKAASDFATVITVDDQGAIK